MRKYKILLVILIVIVFLNKTTYASSININASKKSVSSGETFSVSISANDATGKINISVDNGNVSSKSVWVENNTQSISVTAGNTGNVKIVATGEVSDSNGNDQNVSDSVTVDIKAENTNTPPITSNNASPTPTSKPTETTKPAINTKKSNNANLSNLVVSPVDFKGFKASKTEGYSINVDNEVTEVTVKATKQDSKASIEILGNKNLKVGENIVSVVVTAEDGTKKTYKIAVNRKKAEIDIVDTSKDENIIETVALPEEEITKSSPEEEISKKELELGINSLKLLGITNNGLIIEPNIIPKFDINAYEYRCTVSVDVERIELEAVSNIEDSIIEVIGNENLVVGENIIDILVKSADGINKKKYQIIVNKTLETLDLNSNTKLIEDIIKWTIVVIVAVAIIISILIITKKNKKDDIEEIDCEDKKNGKHFK